ncbi:hypothetical protein [Vibrio coralliilyticus]|uniref:hypothetical protein n=1 Tax=Vibrio coralliilyticus TaxID=190893 RepID=UPI00148B6DE8|nr:hypothetical protein [Vibrio coralliilyticus]NOI30712.1 hypothetical protein [Vibrio coralliilyticus]NOI49740.1 hypothetical protein [Vibrio coralliilyticus]WFB48028.1 hypothetical protein P6988_02035 [Vibrio coralliilyticus]
MIDLTPQLLNPDPYLKPSVKMSPFNGSISSYQIGKDYLAKQSKLGNLLLNRDGHFSFTKGGRQAIQLVLEKIVDKGDFLISIITPSGSTYVSGCVTNEISKVCQYEIGYSDDADAYFFIHEFGRCAEIPQKVLLSGKYIIEDCAYALVHPEYNAKYGKAGDFVIFSFPKAFNMQYGGALFSKYQFPCFGDEYIKNLFFEEFKDLYLKNKYRLENYRSLQREIKQAGLKEYLPATRYSVPHAIYVEIPPYADLETIKIHMNNVGVESSVFYGNPAYFLPCHHNLTKLDMKYMIRHLKYIIDETRRK